MTAKHGSTVLTNFTYSYLKPSTTTKTGIRYSVTDANSNVTKYTYDALNRLTDASVYNSGNVKTAEYGYGFDGAGNRTTATLPSGTSSYDGDGNLTGNSAGFGAVYNALNQTTSITPPGQSAQSYNYTGPNQAQLFNNNGNQMLYDKTGLYGNGTDSYFHDTHGNLLAAAIGAGTYYYLEDGLGSIVGLTDVSGNVVQSYQYDPYGNVTSSTGSVTANPWQFAGGFYDSTTGLYKFGIRYYDPTLGRWTQQDPLGGSLFDPSTGNRYAYTNDDPTNFTDPSGKSGIGCGLAVASVGVDLVGVALGPAGILLGFGLAAAGTAVTVAEKPTPATGFQAFGQLVLGTNLTAFSLAYHFLAPVATAIDAVNAVTTCLGG